MAQYNLTTPNGSGLNVRTDINEAFQSAITYLSGNTDPSTLSPTCAYPYVVWADTGNNLLKQRSEDNSTWNPIGIINADGSFSFYASKINNTAVNLITATNVQNAIEQLSQASYINNTAAGNITATNQQAVNNYFDSIIGSGQTSRNAIINGDMRVSQINGSNSVTVTAGAAKNYTIDQWYSYCTGANVTVQMVASGVNGRQYKLQYTGAAGNTAIQCGQRIESLNCLHLAGQVCTLQAQLSNSTLTTVTWTAYYANTTNTFGTIASPTRTQIATGTWTVTTSEAVYTAQISIPSAATTGIEIVFSVAGQTTGTFTVTGVQLEKGSIATPFEVVPMGRQLLDCMRYFNTSVCSYETWATGNYINTIILGMPMIINPTVSFINNTAPANGTPSVFAVNQNRISFKVENTTNSMKYWDFTWTAVAQL